METAKYKPASRDTICRWVKTVLAAAKVDLQLFGLHSTRAASATKARFLGMPLDMIMEQAGWANPASFYKHYFRKVQYLPNTWAIDTLFANKPVSTAVYRPASPPLPEVAPYSALAPPPTPQPIHTTPLDITVLPPPEEQMVQVPVTHDEPLLFSTPTSTINNQEQFMDYSMVEDSQITIQIPNSENFAVTQPTAIYPTYPEIREDTVTDTNLFQTLDLSALSPLNICTDPDPVPPQPTASAPEIEENQNFLSQTQINEAWDEILASDHLNSEEIVGEDQVLQPTQNVEIISPTLVPKAIQFIQNCTDYPVPLNNNGLDIKKRKKNTANRGHKCAGKWRPPHEIHNDHSFAKKRRPPPPSPVKTQSVPAAVPTSSQPSVQIDFPENEVGPLSPASTAAFSDCADLSSLSDTDPEHAHRTFQSCLQQGYGEPLQNIPTSILDPSEVAQIKHDGGPTVLVIRTIPGYPASTPVDPNFQGCSHVCFLSYPNKKDMDMVDMFVWPEMRDKPFLQYLYRKVPSKHPLPPNWAWMLKPFKTLQLKLVARVNDMYFKLQPAPTRRSIVTRLKGKASVSRIIPQSK